jgi:flagellar basal-body rod modification protein FlgD
MDISTVSVTSTSGGTAANANAGALPVPERSRPNAETDPQFGELLNNIQAKYGQKAEKPREIKKTLGKDDFMKIMIMQMRNQDPTQPFKAEQMAAELAQYASVEQLQNLNQTVGKLIANQNPMERLAMTHLIGKSVTVDRERFSHESGENHALNFTLPKDAKSVKAQVWNDANEMIFEKDLGDLKAGDGSLMWDGSLSNGLAAKAGGYRLKIDARDEGDLAIQSNPRVNSKIIGVSFEGQEPVFLVGDPNRPDKISMKNIIRIDDAGPAGSGVTQLVPGARSLADVAAGAGRMEQGASALPAAGTGVDASRVNPSQTQSNNTTSEKGANFFTFQKGVGSQALNTNQLTPEVRRQLAIYEQQRLDSESAKTAQNGSENRGFPNGLSE